MANDGLIDALNTLKQIFITTFIETPESFSELHIPLIIASVMVLTVLSFIIGVVIKNEDLRYIFIIFLGIACYSVSEIYVGYNSAFYLNIASEFFGVIFILILFMEWGIGFDWWFIAILLGVLFAAPPILSELDLNPDFVVNIQTELIGAATLFMMGLHQNKRPFERQFIRNHVAKLEKDEEKFRQDNRMLRKLNRRTEQHVKHLEKRIKSLQKQLDLNDEDPTEPAFRVPPTGTMNTTNSRTELDILKAKWQNGRTYLRRIEARIKQLSQDAHHHERRLKPDDNSLRHPRRLSKPRLSRSSRTRRQDTGRVAAHGQNRSGLSDEADQAAASHG